MEILINKTELAGALSALGKLVSRTSLIKSYQGIQIEGKANTLFFRTRNVTEEIEFRLSADLEEDFPATLVEFEQFRQAVRNGKNKTLKMEIDNGEVYIGDILLAPVKGRFPMPETITDQNVCITELPTDTLSALTLLAPVADKGTDPRKILRGINISREGFTSTNGKELSNIPSALTIDGVTIPFPLALLATKAFGESGKLTTWQTDEDTLFELSLGNWTWRAKAIKGGYPNWKHIVPERSDKTHFVTFQNEQAGKLQRYLKGVPDDPQNNNGIKLSRLPEDPDTLHLESSTGMLFSIPAEFDPNWDDLSFVVRKEFLLHLLDAEHRKIELNDAFGPIIGTGGTGQYIAMPVYVKKLQAQTKQSAEQVAVQAEPVEAQTIPESTESAPEQNPPHKDENPAIPYTPSTKEKPTMENTVPRIVSAPMQTSAQNNESMNPLDELTANIEAMKGKLKTMFDESAALARKVREVAISQRQKEREYQQAKRAIERIRVATGAA